VAIKDWILIVGVASLVLERVIRWIFRLIRPEKEIDCLAMDMVKLQDKIGYRATPLTHFYLYKGALKKGFRWNGDYVRYLEHKEERINQSIDTQNRIIENNYAVIVELNEVLERMQKEAKLPEELKDLLYSSQALLQNNKSAMTLRMEKITAVINKVFRKSKQN